MFSYFMPIIEISGFFRLIQRNSKKETFLFPEVLVLIWTAFA